MHTDLSLPLSFLYFFVFIQMVKFDPTKSSNKILIMFVGMLHIYNPMYFKHFIIIKYVNFEPIIFIINLSIVLCLKILTFFIMCSSLL